MHIPVFTYTDLEAQAVTVMELLAGRSPSLPLTAEARRPADALVYAYLQGNKPKAFQLSQIFYNEVLQAGKVSAAYFKLADMHLTGNSDFQIVMDSLKENHGHHPPLAAAQLDLDEALMILLLAITCSDKNAISYHRIDEKTGKHRPTTFPLTLNLIRNFLAPFGDKSSLMKRYLILNKGMVMGNPAAWIAQLYRVRKQAFLQQQAAWEQAQTKAVAQKQPDSGPKIQEVKIVCEDLRKMLEGSHDDSEKAALMHSLQPDQLMQLLRHNDTPQTDPQAHSRDFRLQLESMYATRLTKAQASYLSARLSSRMKRLLEQMGCWKDAYWSEFQTMMQLQGVWEGSEWLDKWRAGKKGKQHLSRSGKDYLIPEKTHDLSAMLLQAEKIQDKQKGQRMLAPVEPTIWQRPTQIRSTPEQRKVLLILSRPDRLNELIHHAFAPAVWETTPAVLRQRLFEGFALLGDTDFDSIKSQYLAACAPDELEAARTLIAILELKFNQITQLFKQDLGMTLGHALELLTARQQEIAQREKMNSPQWQNSAANQYHRYKQA